MKNDFVPGSTILTFLCIKTSLQDTKLNKYVTFLIPGGELSERFSQLEKKSGLKWAGKKRLPEGNLKTTVLLNGASPGRTYSPSLKGSAYKHMWANGRATHAG